jgi:precorrin-6B methylase 2
MINKLESGFLTTSGWLKSAEQNKCLNGQGDFIPWYNYAIIDFLDQKLTQEMSVFEFGCGYSTLFYAKRCGRVYSVDVKKEWIIKIGTELFAANFNNTEINLVEKKFAESIDVVGEKFDIIVVDSEDRLSCCITAYYNLSKNGIVILDNSERENYKEIFDFFAERGFKNLTFSGIGSLRFEKSSTTIFYRINNVFNI